MSCNSGERLRRVRFKGFVLKISCGFRFLIIIISSSSHHHHHHLIIIISPSSSSSSPSLSLAFLFFSILAQPSSHEKRAQRNPSQGKCVLRAKKCQKLRVFCFSIFRATLCGNPAVKCQKLRFFAIFGRMNPSQGKRGSSVKNWGFAIFGCLNLS